MMLKLDGTSLTIDALAAFAHGDGKATIAPDTAKRMDSARAIVDQALASGAALYGVTTGVGSQKDFRLSPDAIREFNNSLVRAHATRLPEQNFDLATRRATLAIMANVIGRGRSGVRREVAERLCAAASGDLPEMQEGGSVGAADLVPLMQLVTDQLDKGLVLEAKEALGLMCSNAVTLADAALVLSETEHFLQASVRIVALSLEGFRGNLNALRAARVMADDGQLDEGSAETVSLLEAALKGSALWNEGEARLLQDPLSFRCVVPILGAAFSAFSCAKMETERLLNASVDNPMVTSAGLLSHGMMDTTGLCLVFDTLRLAVGKLLRVGGERTHKLHWGSFTGLPVGLADEASAAGGLQYLNISHLAEAQIAEAISFTSPVTLLYSGQLADGVEDTASHAPLSVRQLRRMLPAAWNALALEMTCGVWAVHRRGVKTLGKEITPIVKNILPLLPVSHEGKALFDMTQCVEWLKQS